MRFLVFMCLSLVVVSVRAFNEVGESANECEPGTTFKIDCNTCSCTSKGKIICTLMLCENKNVSPEPVQDNPLLRQPLGIRINWPCEAGSTFKAYCNNCTCGLDGYGFACTRMACDKEIWNEDGTLRHPELVETSPQRAEQVPNNSLLRQRGQVSDNRLCVAGSSFRIYCNYCTCGSDGFSVACTRMRCSKEIWNEDGSRKQPEPVETSAQRPEQVPNNALLRQRRQISDKRECEPGSLFMRSCNTCACGLDGRVTDCTRRICNPLLRKFRQVSMDLCVPGERFTKHGVTCICQSDGVKFVCQENGTKKLRNVVHGQSDILTTP